MKSTAACFAAVLALLVGGCCDSARDAAAGAAGAAGDAGAETGGDTKATDIAFLQKVLYLGKQTTMLCAMAGGRTADDRVLTLAQQIYSEQRNESHGVQAQLVQRDAPVQGALPGAEEGLLDQAAVDALTALRGTEFDKAFLSALITQRTGARTLAQHEIDHGRDVDVVSVATPIIQTAGYQVEQLTQLLDGR